MLVLLLRDLVVACYSYCGSWDVNGVLTTINFPSTCCRLGKASWETLINAKYKHELAINVLGGHPYCPPLFHFLLLLHFLLHTIPIWLFFLLVSLVILSSSQPSSFPVLCTHLCPCPFALLHIFSIPIKILFTSHSLFLICVPLIISFLPSQLQSKIYFPLSLLCISPRVGREADFFWQLHLRVMITMRITYVSYQISLMWNCLFMLCCSDLCLCM